MRLRRRRQRGTCGRQRGAAQLAGATAPADASLDPDQTSGLQGASQATADNAAALAAASGKAEREARHRLGWLAQHLPAVEARLADLEREVAPPAGTAADDLAALAERVEASKPPLEEAEAARDAAVAALLADLALPGMVRTWG